MPFDDFMRLVLGIFPDAMVDEDPETGELIVFTGIREEGQEGISLGLS